MKYLSVFLLFSFLLSSSVTAMEPYIEHFLKGLEFKKNGQYGQAIKAFDRAIELKNKEKKRIRFYGMRYGSYHPYREKGICLYFLQQYQPAVKALEKSLAQVKTDEGEKYIKLAQERLNAAQKDVFKAKHKAQDYQIPPELKEIKLAKFKNPHAVAVIIGNRDYQHQDIPPVSFAVNDAIQVKEFFIKSFGIREENIIFKTNATKGTFENIFGTYRNHAGRLFDYVAKEKGLSDVFIHYSGHGAPSLNSKKGFILPVDASPNNIDLSGYPIELLYANLAKLQAKSRTIVIDACFSGARIFKNASPVGIHVKNPLIVLKNSAILNSSSSTQLSSWYGEKGHGLFTYYFLLGLTGKADKDFNHEITLQEIEEFISGNVPYKARQLYEGRKQIPTFEYSNKDQVLIRYK